MENSISQAEMRHLEATHGEPRPLGKLPRSSQIAVFRSRDYAAIRRLCVHPRIFPLISDDFTSDPKKWTLPENEQVIYLLASDSRGPFGFGIFHPATWACWNAHFGFLPASYGADALHSFARMLDWMWQNTSARRVVGEIVRENTLAVRFARAAGCEVYGVNKKSYLRGGILHDQVCLGISKPE